MSQLLKFSRHEYICITVDIPEAANRFEECVVRRGPWAFLQEQLQLHIVVYLPRANIEARSFIGFASGFASGVQASVNPCVAHSFLAKAVNDRFIHLLGKPFPSIFRNQSVDPDFTDACLSIQSERYITDNSPVLFAHVHRVRPSFTMVFG